MSNPENPIARMGTSGTSGVLKGRFNSGCVFRMTHTPALTSTNASNVPTLVISSRICRGSKVASMATKMPTTMELIYGVRKRDRKSTRLNSSHRTISYAVFCLKKKKTTLTNMRPYNVYAIASTSINYYSRHHLTKHTNPNL